MVNFLDALKTIDKAETVEDCVVQILIIYLIDIWELGITQAAGLINIWIGITKLMPFAFLFLMDYNFIDSYSMLLISTAASALGTGLLSSSTPSWVYSGITGSCSEYKMECITTTQQSLFYMALILIMIGRSARNATKETLNFKSSANKVDMRHDYLFPSIGYLLALETNALSLGPPWSIVFGISSVYSSVAVFQLMGKSWSHKLYINKPERSYVTSVLRVIATSISNQEYLPYESAWFQEDETGKDDLLLHRTSSLRFIEIAAFEQPNDNRRPNRWTHCSLQDVENAKTFVRMLPLGFTLAFLMLIHTIGLTYFLQQSKRLIPIDISYRDLFVDSGLAYLFSRILNMFQLRVTNNSDDDTKRLDEELLTRKVLNTLILAIKCYAIATLVEYLRLRVIRKHSLKNKPDRVIPMTFLWLFPQFTILRLLEAGLKEIFDLFLSEDIPLPMKNLKIFVLEGFVGVGIMSSVLVVYLVGKFSEMNGKPNWFQHDTENSRLDLFYWVLTASCVFVFALWLFRYLRMTTNFMQNYAL